MATLRAGMTIRVTWLDTRLDVSRYDTVRVLRTMGDFVEVAGIPNGRPSWAPISAMRDYQEILTPATYPELAVTLLQRRSGQMQEKNGCLFVASQP